MCFLNYLRKCQSTIKIVKVLFWFQAKNNILSFKRHLFIDYIYHLFLFWKRLRDTDYCDLFDLAVFAIFWQKGSQTSIKIDLIVVSLSLSNNSALLLKVLGSEWHVFFVELWLRELRKLNEKSVLFRLLSIPIKEFTVVWVPIGPQSTEPIDNVKGSTVLNKKFGHT